MQHGDSDGATEFLAEPSADAAETADAVLAPGAHVGAYVIREVLGEGGMGSVYLALQTQPVRREVALKLIRGQVAGPVARAYFDVERQALAQMQHPAIAQVYDAGTTADGRPYLAMERVVGVPITRYCRDHRLGLDARLALFVRVCRGVQHAHQKGIIHRDLKPANVLVEHVDGVAMPKIIDFGIAVGGDAPGANAAAAAADGAGTAIYMSPEQGARAPRGLDTRSDVYSLGVMLFEVLTDADATRLTSGVRDSVPVARATLLAAIASELPAASSSAVGDALLDAARGVPAELRAVLRKALAADRERRYDSAAALADDLERFRERRPITALPWTRLYLARTFVARHRLAIAAAALIALALVAGTALALAGLADARRSAAVARVEAAKAAQVAEFVRGILAGIDPDRAKGMDRALMRSVLDAAADRAEHELRGQPAVRAEIERTIADSYASLGEFALAERHYGAALVAAEAAALPARQRADLTTRSADMVRRGGDAQRGLALGRAALALVAPLAPDDRDRLSIESRLADLEASAGELDASRTRYLRVLELERRRLGEDDEETLATMYGLALTDVDLARFDEARPLYETLIERRRARYGDEHSKTLDATNGLAVLELEQHHFAAAEKLLAPQMPIYERVFGADHPMTMQLLMNLGGAIRQQGRNEEARPYYERAAALANRLFGPRNATTIMTESNLALLLRDAGELAEAERHGHVAVVNAEAVYGDNPLRAIIMKDYATVLTRERRYAEAERTLDHAWRLLSAKKEYGLAHPRTQEVVDAYVELYTAWDKPERAAAWRARKAPAAAPDAIAGAS
ncbi:MAG TPA: serine/threonine-protein kinase [Dokdonella sp.]